MIPRDCLFGEHRSNADDIRCTSHLLLNCNLDLAKTIGLLADDMHIPFTTSNFVRSTKANFTTTDLRIQAHICVCLNDLIMGFGTATAMRQLISPDFLSLDENARMFPDFSF